MQTVLQASLFDLHNCVKPEPVARERQQQTTSQHAPNHQQYNTKCVLKPQAVVSSSMPNDGVGSKGSGVAETPTGTESARDQLDDSTAAADQLQQAVQVSLQAGAPDECASNSSSASCQISAEPATAEQRGQSAEDAGTIIPVNCSDVKVLARALAHQLKSMQFNFSTIKAKGRGVVCFVLAGTYAVNCMCSSCGLRKTASKHAVSHVAWQYAVLELHVETPTWPCP